MSTITGRRAEEAAAEYLQRQGYGVVHRNWRTRWCEIDIVAVKEQVVYFVEVKYRSSDNYGRGLEYITPQKKRQMQFAAAFWMSKYSMNTAGEFALYALEVSGPAFEVTDLVEIILG